MRLLLGLRLGTFGHRNIPIRVRPKTQVLVSYLFTFLGTVPVSARDIHRFVGLDQSFCLLRVLDSACLPESAQLLWMSIESNGPNVLINYSRYFDVAIFQLFLFVD